MEKNDIIKPGCITAGGYAESTEYGMCEVLSIDSITNSFLVLDKGGKVRRTVVGDLLAVPLSDRLLTACGFAAAGFVVKAGGGRDFVLSDGDSCVWVCEKDGAYTVNGGGLAVRYLHELQIAASLSGTTAKFTKPWRG